MQVEIFDFYGGRRAQCLLSADSTSARSIHGDFDAKDLVRHGFDFRSAGHVTRCRDGGYRKPIDSIAYKCIGDSKSCAAQHGKQWRRTCLAAKGRSCRGIPPLRCPDLQSRRLDRCQLGRSRFGTDTVPTNKNELQMRSPL